MLSSCMLWLSVSKARLVQSPMQTFFLALMCPSRCTRSHSGKKVKVFYQPSSCLSRIPLPGLVVVMRMSIPASCTFLVITDKFRSWMLGSICSSYILVGVPNYVYLHIKLFGCYSPFILVLVAEYVEHSCKTLGQ